MEATTRTPRIAEVAGAVTVLFTDVAGSTELLSDLGDEAMEGCWREHFAILRAEVATHRGREVKSMGDGLMVVFDSPSDALACAIAMQTAVAGHASAGGPALRMRVGLHCGPTIEREGDHRGTTVVVAHRLCDVAQPGEILATAAVIARAARGRGSSRDLGDLTLKGLSEPVPVHAVQWARAPDSRLAEREPLGVELAEDLRRAGGIVGRHREVERLCTLWRASAAGRRQLVVVAGEPGIGKTSLVAELARVVHASGAIVLYGRCDEGFATPLQPVAEALRHIVTAPTRPRSRSSRRCATPSSQPTTRCEAPTTRTGWPRAASTRRSSRRSSKPTAGVARVAVSRRRCGPPPAAIRCTPASSSGPRPTRARSWFMSARWCSRTGRPAPSASDAPTWAPCSSGESARSLPPPAGC
jgi:class 3 adenylate cyclase